MLGVRGTTCCRECVFTLQPISTCLGAFGRPCYRDVENEHRFIHVLQTTVFPGLLGQLRRAIAMIRTLLLLGIMALVAPSMSYSCYGDISALQAPLVPCTAVRASDCGLALVRSSAEADIIRLRKYEIPIKRVARNLCLEPALIAGIISQESRVGLLLDNGWDQERHKYGLMQLGGHQQPFGLWDSEEHINQCSTILVLSINEVRARHPTWSWDRQLRDIVFFWNRKPDFWRYLSPLAMQAETEDCRNRFGRHGRTPSQDYKIWQQKAC
ncbi:lysozyme g-like isoform X2 [Lathamus discolor]|uniref:lysozyme g-like isoform X2 n=1 Tax=Lathamus discolor TaxID=678569 RepID=UPI0032B7A326